MVRPHEISGRNTGDGTHGASDIACGGTDCDDANPNRYPGNTEICDVGNLDEDCDDRTFGFRDLDGDGSPDAQCRNGDVCGDDCDDMRPSVHGSAPETCDTFDNDCDGTVDEGVLLTWYPDLDRDSFGDPAGPAVTACTPPAMHVLDNIDCDDGDSSTHPGAFDVCDGTIDHDCNGTVDDPPGGCDCTSGDNRNCLEQRGRCMGATQSCIAGTWETCTIVPSAEVCNGMDDDCDGMTDEGLPTTTYYRDADSDGFGDPADSLVRCELPTGYVADSRDCYDMNGDARPTQTNYFMVGRDGERAGSFDYNCDMLETKESTNIARCDRDCGLQPSSGGWALGPPMCGVIGDYATNCEDMGGIFGCQRVTERRMVRCH